MSLFGSIYTNPELPSRAKLVYMYLRDRSDRNGTCWPGIKTIAKDLNLSPSTVKRALNDLSHFGLISKQPRFRKNGGSTSNLYKICNPK
ncbi:MAG: helix-turn-helix domain-containing protein [Oscillospiraceae bacterium]|nr:helix-turn-helix domain-containing protein [Oscillospiraceae bacterium]